MDRIDRVMTIVDVDLIQVIDESLGGAGFEFPMDGPVERNDPSRSIDCLGSR